MFLFKLFCRFFLNSATFSDVMLLPSGRSSLISLSPRFSSWFNFLNELIVSESIDDLWNAKRNVRCSKKTGASTSIEAHLRDRTPSLLNIEGERDDALFLISEDISQRFENNNKSKKGLTPSPCGRRPVALQQARGPLQAWCSLQGWERLGVRTDWCGCWESHLGCRTNSPWFPSCKTLFFFISNGFHRFFRWFPIMWCFSNSEYFRIGSIRFVQVKSNGKIFFEINICCKTMQKKHSPS